MNSKKPERLITVEKVERFLQEQESVNLEFKQTMDRIYCGKEQGEAFHKGELIKDLLSLANRNVAYAGETSYLIIGAANDQDDNGYRVDLDRQTSRFEPSQRSCLSLGALLPGVFGWRSQREFYELLNNVVINVRDQSTLIQSVHCSSNLTSCWSFNNQSHLIIRH